MSVTSAYHHFVATYYCSYCKWSIILQIQYFLPPNFVSTTDSHPFYHKEPNFQNDKIGTLASHPFHQHSRSFPLSVWSLPSFNDNCMTQKTGFPCNVFLLLASCPDLGLIPWLSNTVSAVHIMPVQYGREGGEMCQGY